MFSIPHVLPQMRRPGFNPPLTKSLLVLINGSFESMMALISIDLHRMCMLLLSKAVRFLLLHL